MAKDKGSFVIYCDLIHTIEHLTDTQAGKLFKLILQYVNDQNPPSPTDKNIKIAFEPIKRQLKRDLKDWEEERSRRSEAGKKGMANRWKSKETITDDNSVKQPITSITDNVTVTVTDTVNVTDTVKRERNGFAPPAIEDVILYMSESLDEFSAMGEANKFINYYSSNGWMVGKNKMKNWRGAAAGWISRKDNFKNSENGERKKGTSEARITALKDF